MGCSRKSMHISLWITIHTGEETAEDEDEEEDEAYEEAPVHHSLSALDAMVLTHGSARGWRGVR